MPLPGSCSGPGSETEGRGALRRAPAGRHRRSEGPAWSTRCSGGVGVRHWERYPELRAARLRFDGDLSVVVANETAHDVESEPGTLSHRLGGEEGVEDPFA